MHPMKRVATAVAGVGAVLLLWSKLTQALPLSPFSTIAAIPETQLTGAHVRLTMVAEGGRLPNSLAFTTTGSALNIDVFKPFYRRNISYGPDESAVAGGALSTHELKVLIDSVATLPEIVQGGVAQEPYLSFSIFVPDTGAGICFESVVERRAAMRLMTKLLSATASNAVANQELAKTGCNFSILIGQPAAILDGQVAIRLVGLRRVRGTPFFVGSLRVTNTSGATVGGPLAVAVRLGGSAELSSPAGYTCLVQPGGTPYVRAPGASSLAPGQSVSVPVRVLNRSLRRITIDRIRVFREADTW